MRNGPRRSGEGGRATFRVGLPGYGLEGEVSLDQGDSAGNLARILAEVEGRAFVFLDAHYMPGDRRSEIEGGAGWKGLPLRLELAALAAARYRGHIIAIDDIDCAGTPAFGGVTLEEIKALLLEVNPGYQFEVCDSCRPGALLIADCGIGIAA